ncbi:MAG: hypothetical protein ABFD54_00905 [Armatimonadota bacterium]|nr:hypothetical protein [bacterium]
MMNLYDPMAKSFDAQTSGTARTIRGKKDRLNPATAQQILFLMESMRNPGPDSDRRQDMLGRCSAQR